MKLTFDPRGGWAAEWRGCRIWGCWTPWGALYGAWQMSRFEL